MQKILKTTLVGLFVLTLFIPVTTFALAIDTQYVPLTDIPGISGAKGVASSNPGGILQSLFNLAIGIGGILAIIMIIFAGFKYMYEESISGKSDAKSKITNAFFGLLLILGSYIILKTINSDLLRINLFLPAGDGKLAGLVSKQKAFEDSMDSAIRAADMALRDAKDLRDQIANTDKEIADLKAKIGSATTGFDAEKARLATLESTRQALTNKELYVRANADPALAITRAQNEVFGNRSASGATLETNVVSTLTSAQRNLNGALQQLEASDTTKSNPETQKQILELKAKKLTLDASTTQLTEIAKYNEYQTYIKTLATDSTIASSIAAPTTPKYTDQSSMATFIYNTGRDAAYSLRDSGNKEAGLALLSESKTRAQQVCPSCKF